MIGHELPSQREHHGIGIEKRAVVELHIVVVGGVVGGSGGREGVLVRVQTEDSAVLEPGIPGGVGSGVGNSVRHRTGHGVGHVVVGNGTK